MRVFTAEFSRILRQRNFVLLLAVFLILNYSLLYTSQADILLSNQELAAAYAFLDKLPPEDLPATLHKHAQEVESHAFTIALEAEPNEQVSAKLLWITKDIWKEARLFRLLEHELIRIESYSDFMLHTLQEKDALQEISIFQETSAAFTRANQIKTRRDLAVVKDIQPCWVNHHSFSSATEALASDFLILMLLIYAVMLLFARDREQGLERLLKPLAKGRSTLVLGKLAVLSALCIALVVLFWSGNFWVAQIKFGRLNWQAPLQSLASYGSSGLPLTIGQYVPLFYLSKILVYLSFILLTLTVTLRSKRLTWIYLFPILFTAGSYILYRLVDGNSAWQIGKYINFIHFLPVYTVYRYYFNLNILGMPVQMLTCFYISMLLVLPLLFFINTRRYNRQECQPLLRSDFLRQLRRSSLPRPSLAAHEGYKLLIARAGGAVLILLVLLQFVRWNSYPRQLHEEEVFYRQYMEQLAGPLTADKRAAIAAEEEAFLSFRKDLLKVQEAFENKKITEKDYELQSRVLMDYLRPESAFQRVLQRLNYLDSRPKKDDKEKQLIYEAGYLSLLGMDAFHGSREEILSAIYLYLALIVVISPYFTDEWNSGMIKLIHTYRHGRERSLLIKLRWSRGLALAFFLGSYLAPLLQVLRLYGLPALFAGSGNIPEFSHFMIEMPLLFFLLLLYSLRFLCMLFLIELLIALAILARDKLWAMQLLTVIFVLPLLLKLLGLALADYFSLNIFLTISPLMTHGRGLGLALLLLPLALAILGKRLIHAYMVVGKEA